MGTNILEGRYRSLRQLGQGGFGDTFLAEDLHMPSKRCCVIKQLKPSAETGAAHDLIQERFQREATLLEQLGNKHEQIPQLYAYAEDGGQFYLIQEWIEGDTLQETIAKGGPWSSREVTQFLLDILPVLTFIHGHGIVHRDIKPANIILRQSDRRPVLIDFGAIKETMGLATSHSQSLPTKSIVIGTPGFMPPEQGIGRPVYGSDLYSLGLTAIYLLTGKTAAELPTDPETGKILWRIWFDDQGAKDQPLIRVLEQAIQPHLQERWKSAQEMKDALESAQDPEAIAPMATEIPSPVTPLPAPPPEMLPEPTIALSNPHGVTPTTIVPKQGLEDWQKAVLTGSIIGSFLLLGMVLNARWLEQARNGAPTADDRTTLQSPNATEEFSATPQKAIEPVKPAIAYQDSCGDQVDGNEAFLYRVVTDREALSTMRNRYCGDSFLREDGTVQLASFTSRGAASDFSQVLTEETDFNFWIQEVAQTPPAPLSQMEASEVIEDWLDCKNYLFDYPYDRDCGVSLLTGKAFHDNISRNDGQQSSVEWLENSGSYYLFDHQSVDEVRKVERGGSGQRAIADVMVTEKRTLYGASGNIDRNASGYDQRLVRYELEKVNGSWKIADYNTLNVIWRR